MSYYSIVTHEYGYLWKKYRPAILKLMIDASESPQEYKFSKHEFQSSKPTERGGYAFVLRAFQGKAENLIKDSFVAKDLLTILQQSGKACELMETSLYEFSLDKQFILHVKREDAPISEETD